MSKMVEQVARAMAQYCDVDPLYWDEFSHEASAIIASMREPTPEMLEAGSCVGGYDGEWMKDNTASIWTEMIDAALGQ